MLFRCGSERQTEGGTPPHASVNGLVYASFHWSSNR